MKRGFLTVSLFLFGQLLLRILPQSDSIIWGEEILFITLVIGLFLGLFLAGYRWARWVTAILLGLYALVIGSMAFQGYGIGFLAPSFLYGAVILMLFSYPTVIQKQETEEDRLKQFAKIETSVLDMNVSSASSNAAVPVTDGFYVGGEIYYYPLLLKRYLSLSIDGLLLFAIMIAAMVAMGESDARQAVMISLGALFTLVYEPILTSYSATIGQRVMGIRVRSMNNPKERINIVQAYIRIFVKWFFGWLSFITINFNPEHRAIHDFAGSSVVINVK